jgi:hypothetical protein
LKELTVYYPHNQVEPHRSKFKGLRENVTVKFVREIE